MCFKRFEGFGRIDIVDVDGGIFGCGGEETTVGRDFNAGYGTVVACVQTDCGTALDVEETTCFVATSGHHISRIGMPVYTLPISTIT